MEPKPGLLRFVNCVHRPGIGKGIGIDLDTGLMLPA
jgi:hypothetical protein